MSFKFQMNVIFSPIIFSIIVISSIFSTPMLAIFTLPVFFIAYPRPLRFWPGNYIVIETSRNKLKQYIKINN